ncbi:Lysine methyltransferase [Taphrina deformans PYCC 5710]|uniref:Lysine methyltransferase n=1 Tax=Taphrina deformans (strain PYCC 5710 / ATCC 11124 / CBS 356.35 / IMI 108563 / JCM 9778 / NBRC 8474) TaxID=1097556 RepID=R4XC66_TAPDE|nr:Lysine methyltransferase [Taphrina deformans PYCC 5710]|eukprot:CCG83467.1 Lysine methyltransferase [Taphrina deformans PYCC 5710]
MEELLAWSEAEGITVHGSITLLRKGEFGSQGTAESDIPAGTTLASIPYKACLTPRLAARHFGVAFGVLARENLEGAVLALYLITCLPAHAHRNPAGRRRWSAYVDALPATFDTLEYWSDGELGLLSGTGLLVDVRARQERWRKQLGRVLELVRWSGETVAAHEWTWSMTVLSSRSFPSSLIPPHADDDGDDGTKSTASHPILLPVLDTFNHASPLPISWLSTATHLSFLSGAPVRGGAQVFNNYGNKSTAEFLTTYGFLSGPDVLALRLPGHDETYLVTESEPVPHALIHALLGPSPTWHDEVRGILGIVRGILQKRTGMRLPPSPAPAADPRPGDSEGESESESESRSGCRRDLATRYVAGQVALCDASVHALSRSVSGILHNHGDHVIVLDHAFKDDSFVRSLNLCFGVASRADAEASGLVDVVFALYLLYARTVGEAGEPLQAQDGDPEQLEQIEDLWQQIESCREIAPQVFGSLDESSFREAMLRVWNESTEFNGTLYIFLGE